MNIYEQIYQKLERIGIMKVTGSVHLKSSGFMDLVIERFTTALHIIMSSMVI